MPAIPAAMRAPILTDPADDRPRLVLADYLDERGDPRGEFIRVQVELAGMLDRPALLERLRALDWPHAEFTVIDQASGAISWYTEFSCAEDQEPHDVAWDNYISVCEAIDPLLSGWSKQNYYSDNDSASFILRPTPQQEALRRREQTLLAELGATWIADDLCDAMTSQRPRALHPLRQLRDRRDWQHTYAAVMRSAQLHRGFVRAIHCVLANWLEFGQALMRAAPLEQVTIDDRQPDADATETATESAIRWVWSVQREEASLVTIPEVIWMCLPGQPGTSAYYPSAEAARAAFSQACLTWARQPNDDR